MLVAVFNLGTSEVIGKNQLPVSDKNTIVRLTKELEMYNNNDLDHNDVDITIDDIEHRINQYDFTIMKRFLHQLMEEEINGRSLDRTYMFYTYQKNRESKHVEKDTGEISGLIDALLTLVRKTDRLASFQWMKHFGEVRMIELGENPSEYFDMVSEYQTLFDDTAKMDFRRLEQDTHDIHRLFVNVTSGTQAENFALIHAVTESAFSSFFEQKLVYYVSESKGVAKKIPLLQVLKWDEVRKIAMSLIRSGSYDELVKIVGTLSENEFQTVTIKKLALMMAYRRLFEFEQAKTMISINPSMLSKDHQKLIDDAIDELKKLQHQYQLFHEVKWKGINELKLLVWETFYRCQHLYRTARYAEFLVNLEGLHEVLLRMFAIEDQSKHHRNLKNELASKKNIETDVFRQNGLSVKTSASFLTRGDYYNNVMPSTKKAIKGWHRSMETLTDTRNKQVHQLGPLRKETFQGIDWENSTKGVINHLMKTAEVKNTYDAWDEKLIQLFNQISIIDTEKEGGKGVL